MALSNEDIRTIALTSAVAATAAAAATGFFEYVITEYVVKPQDTGPAIVVVPVQSQPPPGTTVPPANGNGNGNGPVYAGYGAQRMHYPHPLPLGDSWLEQRSEFDDDDVTGLIPIPNIYATFPFAVFGAAAAALAGYDNTKGVAVGAAAGIGLSMAIFFVTGRQ